jgi:pyrrolysine biosynthesis protein PylC
MDVEAILHHGELKVLEIDARLPSQTPTAVFSSSRMNIVEMLGEIFFYSREPKTCVNSDYRGVIFEHVRLSPGLLEFSGEHIIAKAGPLKLLRDFFGADEALTNYCRSGDSWVATLITTGRDCAEAREKRDDVIKNIRMHCKVNAILDPGPESTGLTSRFRSC